MQKKHKLLQWGQPWRDAFDQPETTGIWEIVGKSGNGKSSFAAQLLRELAGLNIGRAYYNSLEEKFSITFKRTLARIGFNDVKGNVIFECEELTEMDTRLSKRGAPKIAFIDSPQALRARRADLVDFAKKHGRNKLIIFISQADGNKPRGKAAEDLWYFSDLKIMVEGFLAISHGRCNPGGRFTVWEERAKEYWKT